jgi:ketosteroid isomerase-like protein
VSRENVEVVRALFAAWNAGRMDAFRELTGADVILRMPEDWPEPGPFVGRDAVTRQAEQLRETWDTDRFEFVGDFIDVADRVLVRFIWRTAGYGPDANIEATGVFTVRGGKVVTLEHIWDHAQALRAVGLEG